MLMHFKPRVMLYLDQINDASGSFMDALCSFILDCVLLVNADYEMERHVKACDT